MSPGSQVVRVTRWGCPLPFPRSPNHKPMCSGLGKQIDTRTTWDPRNHFKPLQIPVIILFWTVFCQTLGECYIHITHTQVNDKNHLFVQRSTPPPPTPAPVFIIVVTLPKEFSRPSPTRANTNLRKNIHSGMAQPGGLAVVPTCVHCHFHNKNRSTLCTSPHWGILKSHCLIYSIGKHCGKQEFWLTVHCFKCVAM